MHLKYKPGLCFDLLLSIVRLAALAGVLEQQRCEQSP